MKMQLIFCITLTLYPVTFLSFIISSSYFEDPLGFIFNVNNDICMRGSSTSSHRPFLFWTVLKWLIHSAQCCVTMISDHLCLGSGQRREIMTIIDDVACAGYWLPVD